MELKGKYGTAKVFTKDLEEAAREQINTLLDQEFIAGAKVRVMPDVHLGVGSVIGFTAHLKDKIIPNIVGVDIGCGMLTVELGKQHLGLKNLDDGIKTYIPAGTNIHERQLVEFDRLEELHCYRELQNTRRMERSIGTLGGGNHFIGATCC